MKTDSQVGRRGGAVLMAAVVAAFGGGCRASDSPGTGEDGVVRGVSLMSRLSGLWLGPATVTPLGALPVMNMDLRNADPHVLFGRVDLDNSNNLRFALAVEQPAETPELVFRNGGYFLGILRDSRTELVDYQPSGPSYRFCALGLGCDYIDATFSFSGETQLLLDVKVRGQQHLLWSPQRRETRQLPAPFPQDDLPQGHGDAPFPALPQLTATVTFGAKLAADSDVLLVLSTTPCNYLQPSNLGCTVSRSLFGHATAGSSSTTLRFEQIHAGSYNAVAILDRSGMLRQQLMPQSGDGISLPNQAVTVAPVAQAAESTATIPIVLMIP